MEGDETSQDTGNVESDNFSPEGDVAIKWLHNADDEEIYGDFSEEELEDSGFDQNESSDQNGGTEEDELQEEALDEEKSERLELRKEEDTEEESIYELPEPKYVFAKQSGTRILVHAWLHKENKRKQICLVKWDTRGDYEWVETSKIEEIPSIRPRRTATRQIDGACSDSNSNHCQEPGPSHGRQPIPEEPQTTSSKKRLSKKNADYVQNKKKKGSDGPNVLKPRAVQTARTAPKTSGAWPNAVAAPGKPPPKTTNDTAYASGGWPAFSPQWGNPTSNSVCAAQQSGNPKSSSGWPSAFAASVNPASTTASPPWGKPAATAEINSICSTQQSGNPKSSSGWPSASAGSDDPASTTASPQWGKPASTKEINSVCAAKQSGKPESSSRWPRASSSASVNPASTTANSCTWDVTGSTGTNVMASSWTSCASSQQNWSKVDSDDILEKISSPNAWRSSRAIASGATIPAGRFGSSCGTASQGWSNAGVQTMEISYPTEPKKSCKNPLVPRYLTKSEGELTVHSVCHEECIARRLWGPRLEIFKMPCSAKQADPPKSRMFEGKRLSLFATKFQRKEGSPKNIKSQFGPGVGDLTSVKAYYLVEAGPGLETWDTKKKLEEVADWSKLATTPSKLRSRLELLVSPAATFSHQGQVRACTFLFPMDKVEEIEDHHNLGCGFIPEKLLEECLGHQLGALRACAVQVRITAKGLGIFKGVLIRKPGISRIQLPTSMKKVDKCVSLQKKSARGSKVYVLFSQVFPSTLNYMVGRSVNPHLSNPPKSATKDLPKIGSMVRNLLTGMGVQAEYLKDYVEASENLERRNHSWLLGACDPTSALPEGSVFLTGFGVGRSKDMNVFVTRTPCTEVQDSLILPVVQRQPKEMSQENWNFLCSLHFGVIIFSSPKSKNTLSLPEQISNGDLDGDLYFVCWDEQIMRSVCDNGNSRQPKIADRSLDEACKSIINDSICFLAGNEFQQAMVCEELGDDQHVLKSNNTVEAWNEDFIVKDLKSVDRVLGHRGNCVQLLFSTKERRWVRLNDVKSMIPDVLADYAIENNLTDLSGWKWCKKYVNESFQTKVIRHKDCTDGVRFEVLFDDHSQSWLPLEDMEPALLMHYVQEKNLSHVKSIEKQIQTWQAEWFETAQSACSKIQERCNLNKLLTKLHSEYSKKCKAFGINNKDAVLLGRAHKKCLEIEKHGGQVQLPKHLMLEIWKKKIPKDFDKFISVL